MEFLAELFEQVRFWHWLLLAALGAMAGRRIFRPDRIKPMKIDKAQQAAETKAAAAAPAAASAMPEPAPRKLKEAAAGAPATAKARKAPAKPKTKPKTKPKSLAPKPRKAPAKPEVSAKLGKRKEKPPPQTKDLVGREFTLWSPIAHGEGTMRIAGKVRSVSGPDLPAGSRIRVTAANDEILKVEKAG